MICYITHQGLAQLVEQGTGGAEVAGSSPAFLTNGDLAQLEAQHSGRVKVKGSSPLFSTMGPYFAKDARLSVKQLPSAGSARYRQSPPIGSSLTQRALGAASKAASKGFESSRSCHAFLAQW